MYRIITPTKTTTHDTEHAVNPYANTPVSIMMAGSPNYKIHHKAWFTDMAKAISSVINSGAKQYGLLPPIIDFYVPPVFNKKDGGSAYYNWLFSVSKKMDCVLLYLTRDSSTIVDLMFYSYSHNSNKLFAAFEEDIPEYDLVKKLGDSSNNRTNADSLNDAVLGLDEYVLDITGLSLDNPYIRNYIFPKIFEAYYGE